MRGNEALTKILRLTRSNQAQPIINATIDNFERCTLNESGILGIEKVLATILRPTFTKHTEEMILRWSLRDSQ